MTLLLIVTLISMLLAAIMSVIAWRIAREERRRSEARVAALSAEIHAPAAGGPPMVMPAQAGGSRRADIGLRAEPTRLTFSATARSPRWDDDLELRPATGPLAGADLFTAVQPSQSGSRLAAVVAVGAFVFASGVAIVIVLSGGPGSAARTGSQPAPANVESAATAAPRAAVAPVVAPLELVALGHERDGDRLTVRGVVRNPAVGAAMERLTAVVFLFNKEGGFLASGRAPIEPPALGPGGESTFVVILPGVSAVGRYRVSFRTSDRIVPHVDRRELGKS